MTLSQQASTQAAVAHARAALQAAMAKVARANPGKSERELLKLVPREQRAFKRALAAAQGGR